MKVNMESLFCVFGFFWISLNSNSQEIKLNRQERKEIRKAQMAANFKILDSLLNTKSFVLKADYLVQGRLGIIRIPITLNNPYSYFIKVDKSEGVLRIGEDLGERDKGNIEAWEIYKDSKNLNFRLRFSIITNWEDYYITLTVSSDNQASATIIRSGPDQLIMEGHLETINNLKVLKDLHYF